VISEPTVKNSLTEKGGALSGSPSPCFAFTTVLEAAPDSRDIESHAIALKQKPRSIDSRVEPEKRS
jgi:hypothetical protein